MRTMVWILLLAACGEPTVEPASWEGPEAPVSPPPEPVVEVVEGHPDRWYNDMLFDDSQLPHFEVELSAPAFASLQARPEVWVEGAFIYEGVVYEPVGVRCKGENSFLPIDQKSSLKIDFNRYAPLEFMGFKGITLNNMSNDTSMMHERVAYKAFRDAGVPASRVTHSTVTLNARGTSLYALVEDVDEDMIAHWRDPSGTMFEIWDVDFLTSYVLDDNPDNGDFQFEFGNPDDRDQIYDLAVALQAPGEAGITAAEAFIDYDQFILYWAVSSVVGQFDSYPYSSPGDDAHIYLDPDSGLFQFLPHGVDEAFYDPRRDMEGVNGLLATKCKAVPDCRASYAAATWDAFDDAVENELVDYALIVKEQIRLLVEEDVAKNVVYSTGAVYAEQDDMLAFMRGRASDIERDVGSR
ncbi:MAG: catechol 2,3-dioxygenase-like lactoylglutathione lyase family enzyme [Myxococcota bacterium]|jgi:catechol 2,3-dioxygenase-like lactoylglutathione lyase family enzyme